MKNLLSSLVIFLAMSLDGCSSSFWGGTAAGVAGTGAGYEVHARSQIKKLDDDLKSGKITQQEYNIRKDQIRKDSVLQ